jgi:hypothetical protein
MEYGRNVLDRGEIIVIDWHFCGIFAIKCIKFYEEGMKK